MIEKEDIFYYLDSFDARLVFVISQFPLLFFSRSGILYSAMTPLAMFLMGLGLIIGTGVSITGISMSAYNRGLIDAGLTTTMVSSEGNCSAADIFQGAWNASESYLSGMIVIHENISYVALCANNDTEPGTDDTIWEIFMEPLQGPPGPPGMDTPGLVNGSGYGGMSTSSVTIETEGSKTFVLVVNEYAYLQGMRVRAVNDTENWMEGEVISYTESTHTLVMLPDFKTGSGTYILWSIGLAGEIGLGYGGISTTMVALASTGTKTFELEASYTGFAYVIGQRVRVSNDTDAYMEGIVTVYDSSTRTLEFTADYHVGSGTFDVWTVGLTGEHGKGYGGTSTSNETLSDDFTDKTFILSPGFYAYNPGARVRASCGDPLEEVFMEGPIQSFDQTTLTLIMNPEYATDSASCVSWNFSIAGQLGTQGPQGIQGPAGSDSQEMHIMKDVKTSGTAGGAGSLTYAKRTLNTLTSTGGATSLSSFTSSTWTLAAGTYHIRAWSTVYSSTTEIWARIVLALAGSGIVTYGEAMYTPVGGGTARPTLDFILAVGGSTAYEIQQIMSATASTNDLGKAVSEASVSEIYTVVVIIRES